MCSDFRTEMCKFCVSRKFFIEHCFWSADSEFSMYHLMIRCLSFLKLGTVVKSVHCYDFIRWSKTKNFCVDIGIQSEKRLTCLLHTIFPSAFPSNIFTSCTQNINIYERSSHTSILTLLSELMSLVCKLIPVCKGFVLLRLK